MLTSRPATASTQNAGQDASIRIWSNAPGSWKCCPTGSRSGYRLLHNLPYPQPLTGEEIMTDTVATHSTPEELLPDPDGLNDDRALWAETALQSFMDCTGCDQEDALGDLLADLMH